MHDSARLRGQVVQSSGGDYAYRYHRGDGIHLWFCGRGHLEPIASIIS